MRLFKVNDCVMYSRQWIQSTQAHDAAFDKFKVVEVSSAGKLMLVKLKHKDGTVFSALHSNLIKANEKHLELY